MKISILISTLNDGIKKVHAVLLPPREDVEYIISHQFTAESFKEIPDKLKRSDVSISQIAGKGVAKSRNNVMRLATGDIGLFADDDVRYQEHYIDTVQQAFEDNPDTDIALFKIKTPPNDPEYKSYPDNTHELEKTIFSVSSVEIAFSINRTRELGVFFDERFGAGHKLLINSEETIFIDDCLKRGAKIRYFPEYIVEHPYDSTSKQIPRYDKRRNWVTGAYDCRVNGLKALAKVLPGTLKILPDLIKHKVNPLAYFYHRLSAVLYILRTNREHK